MQIILPVLLAFKEEGGLEVLNKILKTFVDNVCNTGNNVPDDSSKPRVAAFGLKKILDLYLVLANGKYISETSSHFNLQRHAADRTQSVSNIAQQIVAEFRAAILPALMELWNPTFIEKAAGPTVRRLLDILKIISIGDHEPQQTISKDRVSCISSQRLNILNLSLTCNDNSQYLPSSSIPTHASIGKQSAAW